jgi:hypothetical protein
LVGKPQGSPFWIVVYQFFQINAKNAGQAFYLAESNQPICIAF